MIFQVVSALLDFLYTGEMTVDRCDTADLQRLIETLQISPDLISVDVIVEKPSEDVDKGNDVKGDDDKNLIPESGDENAAKTPDKKVAATSDSRSVDVEDQADDGSSEDSVAKPLAQKRKLEQLEDEVSKKPRS